MTAAEFFDAMHIAPTQVMQERFENWERSGLLTDRTLVDKARFTEESRHLDAFDAETTAILCDALDAINENPVLVRYVNLQYLSLGENDNIPFAPYEEATAVIALSHAFSLFGYMDETDRKMRERGIPEPIRTQVHRHIQRAIDLHIDQKGYPGVDASRYFCNRHFLKPDLFPIGNLQFEMCRITPAWAQNGPFAEGDAVVSVHIPAKTDLTPTVIHDSYRRAAAFFKTYYPEWKPKAYCCFSWLLDPKLKACLQENAKILKFQSEYELFEIPSTGKEVFTFVFTEGEVPYEALSEDTSLKRAIKKLYLSGDAIHAYGGWLRASEQFLKGE